MKKKATAIVDLQFGSTGKGLIAGYWAETRMPDVVVTAWAANAGHTYIDGRGRKFVHTMLANGVVSPHLRHILIGPGSLINLDSLKKEMGSCADLLVGKAVVRIHENAGVIQQRHRDQEEGPMTKIGSTKKGCGAALIEKIQRQPDATIIARDALKGTWAEGCLISNHEYDQIVDAAECILVEGAQGYSLGINSGDWPYVTSRECTIHQLLSDCRIPHGMLERVIGVARTFPIRVANRYDEDGKMVGYSGPGYIDQQELTWEQLGVVPERTTVTNLQRRVFTFSDRQFFQACRMSGVTDVFLNFLNYLPKEERAAFLHRCNTMAREASGGRVSALGYGPTADDVEEI